MAKPTREEAIDGMTEAVATHSRGFAVMCEIGRVEFDAMGEEQSPYTAAFRLIGEHGAPGIFTFPMMDGSWVSVDVKQGDERAAKL